MSQWLSSDALILASKSPSRLMLVRNAGIPAEVRPADIDERAVERDSGANKPGDVAAHLARAKALAVSRGAPGRLVLGADQTLALGERRFSKPRDRNEAAAQLRSLAGESHELHAAAALARDGAVLFTHVAVARMTMRQLSDAFIASYLDEAGDAVLGCVGGYQLEALGVQLFAAIDGDHFTILGLPLLPLLEFLRRESWMRQ
ncbi:MAG: septum formation inhibitor Maf [Xanthobacteraceae bacterium]|nr:MAG: septum formation inhibitor Maf [Xanthobacteraceae bacterium]